MTLFDSFKQPNWQHKDPARRIQAISELDDPQILFELVCKDGDAAVQRAALEKINQAAMLDELIEQKLSPAVQSQAKAQRLQLLLPQVEALHTISDEIALLHIIQLSEDAELTASAIDRIEKEETLANLARQHLQSKARLHAAQRIRNLEIIGQLMQSSRGHDKAVFRHCKNLLDEVHARDKAAAEQQEKISRLLVRMAELGLALDSPVYEGQYRSLVQEWQAVEQIANSDQKAEFQRHQAVCGQRLIDHHDARLESERRQAENQAAQQQFSNILQNLDEIEATLVTPSDEAELQQFTNGFSELGVAWQNAAKVSRAPANLETLFKARLQRWNIVAATVGKLLEKANQVQKLLADSKHLDGKNYTALEKQIAAIGKFLVRLQWPENITLQLPEPMQQLLASVQRLQQQLAALQQDQQKLAKRLSELTSNISTSLEQQQPGDADKAMAKVRKLLHSLAPQQKQKIEQALAPLAARLNEFHDWQNFAIEPKKVGLCERMSALIGQTDDVELLALNIQTLQAEWKQLGQLPHAREQELWMGFKAAADEAWKPCKQEFAEQAELRRRNLALRMQLVEQLTAYEQQMHWPEVRGEGDLSGPVPDWALVQKTLDTARSAFRSAGPVEPKGERTSQKAFKEICDRLYGHIRAEYQRNIDRKQGLLERARKLLELEDLKQAINSVKLLQSDWTATGMTPVAVDRKLWKEFRGACDAVFARLDQQRKAEKQEAGAQVLQAESLRDQARALLDNPDPDQIAQLPRSIAEMKSAIAAINLPPPVQQAMSKQLQAMESQARELLGQKRKQAETQAWMSLAEILQACASVSDAAGSEPIADAVIDALPKGIDRQGLREFLRVGPVGANDEACQQACIALEVFGEIGSPAEDKQARMKYQLGRLTQGLGHQVLEPEQELLRQINGFIALRPERRWVDRYCAGLHKIRA
jgi:exonuclease SbcC